MGEQLQIVVDSKDGHSYLWERMSNGDTIGNNATLNVITDDSWLPEEILRLTITDDTDPSCPEAYVYATINIFDQNSKPDATVFVEGNNQGKIVTVLEGTSVTLTSLAPYNYNTYYWTNSSNEELATEQEFSITAERREKLPGVWVKRKINSQERIDKIGAIGIRISRWIAYHGISININPDLSMYDGIVPCGITQGGVTSLADLGIKSSMDDFDQVLAHNFENLFLIDGFINPRNSIRKSDP